MSVRHGDLKDMVIPLISVDEFSAKTGVDSEVIVVAFFCKDEMPAYDLDDFIDKGLVDILDSEVSPNPNDDGFWLVFVEFKRQPNFWYKLFELVKDVENLTTKLNWEVQAYKQPKLFDLKDDELRVLVPTTEDSYKEARTETEITEYFEESNLTNFVFGDTILFEGYGGSLLFDYIDFDLDEKVYKNNKLDECVFDFQKTSPKAHALKSLLGADWSVSLLENYIIVNKQGSDKIVVLK